ncbi:TetR/AcrR family transcriptional regulator [Luteimonas vadosa]|uniref:HTH tetR-type domain-containing protein n=1 Tax=Luteimonas vadosa TaxID=1165507 RepID=A0ABP9E6I6_9GAMM
MTRRRYRLGKRGQAAEDTRRRLVEATYALHVEQGIVATSMKQIAERAGVAVGTVYHHFPQYADAINACGAHVMEQAPMPGMSVLDGHAAPADRLRALAVAWFTYYAARPGWARLHGERDQVPQLAAMFEAQREQRRTQLAAALRPLKTPPPTESQQMAVALLDTGTYLSLRESGLDVLEAAEEIAAVLCCRLLPAPSVRSK